MTTKSRQTTKPKQSATGIIAGFNKGHKTTKRARPVSRKARLGLPKKRLRAVKAVINDIVGFSPLERRVVELLRVGKEKRALKFVKSRLGNMTAAKKKRTKVEDAMRLMTKKK